MNIKKYQELAPNTLNKDLTYTMHQCCNRRSKDI